MTSIDNIIISIDLDDVRAAGGVEQALHEYCRESDQIGSRVVGPTYSTSGPGSGWAYQHTADDFARRAMSAGALYYLEASDGRIAYAPTWEDDMYQGQDIEWTDGSMVRLECPDIEDAMQHPTLVAEMVRWVIAAHGRLSDRQEWTLLVRRIRAADDALADIREADLDE